MSETLAPRLESLQRTELVLVATAVINALAAHHHRPLLAIGLALIVVLYLRPGWLCSPWPWLVASAANAIVDAGRFLELDNHIVLTHYWVLAVGLSLLATHPDRSLELNGRLLMGLTMGLAVASKVMWGEYLDGSFFEATILTDDRFSWIANAVGIDDVQQNYERLHRLAPGPDAVPLGTSDLVRPLAMALSIATLLTEGALAVVCLAPTRSGATTAARTALLAAFCVATYALVPVAGFGSVLLVMASTDRRLQRHNVLRRLGAAAALFGWAVVWQALH